MASDNLKYLNDDNFESTIKNGVTLVDFYADWCGPCRRIAPIVEELASEMGNQVTIAKLDVEQAQRTTAAQQVMSIPTVVLYKNGQEVTRIVGLTGKDSLKKIITSAL